MSDILKSIHDDMQALYEIDAVSEVTMRNFDVMCLSTVPKYTPERIKQLRKKFRISQSVLAAYLCVSTKAVQKWELGTSKPAGATAKLLVLAEKNGLKAIA
ncbi:MAG: helix-turn-helix domain-containing protein [Oceanospirillaceae bacterium]|nr:helix-turn-helix domain-containing protein [Oceanospirillaceae bacterium]